MLKWLMDEKLIASKQMCERCGEEMSLVECSDRSDGYRWQCRKQDKGRRHKFAVSIRKGSWITESNLTIEEVLKYTYWWTQGLDQCQIRRQLKLNQTVNHSKEFKNDKGFHTNKQEGH